MKKFFYFLLVTIAFSCANDPDPAADQSEFVRIYDTHRFSTSYYPIDMTSTADGGYLLLAGRRLETSNFKGIYIMRVDPYGKFISDMEVKDDLVNPVGRLMSLNGKHYFFAMTSVGLQTQLVELDDFGSITKTTAVGGSYPTVAALDNTTFILLSYDIGNKQSLVSIVDANGATTRSKGFSIGAGDAVEEPIINHFLRTGKQLPFQVGKTSGGLYFFNGFYNYTLSLVFTNLTSDTPQGVVQGQQDKGGFSQVLPLEGSNFAAARFNFGDNYLLPRLTINAGGVSAVTDLGGNKLPELVSDAPVQIVRATLTGREMLVYASNTRSRQIALFFYDKASGEFSGSHYLGFSNPFEVASLSPTIDGGLAVCGTTYVAGRFSRICLFKLSKEKVEASLHF